MALGGAVLELWAKLGLDSSKFDEGMEKSKGDANKFASFLGNIGKVGAAAFAAVGTATVAMGKHAVEAYGRYEQLEGGIQKLFGDEAMKYVMQNAENAFLTAGMSANDYMETVTGISSALKRSMGDDLQGVADVADIAMRAISDNVNTFGSNYEAVSNAIMGLSRKNYTMIDNLKLGYAGSAQGMLELINDSGVLGEKLTDTSQLATVGFDKMVLAIQKIQENGNIAGTTVNEALKTIEGSSAATKAAWENVVTAIGKGEGISEALNGLSTAIFGTEEEGTGFLSQIIPRIQTTMEGIGNALVEAAPMLAEKIPEILEAIVPTVATTVASLTSTLINFIGQNMPLLVQGGVNMLNWIANGIKNNFPQIVATAMEMLTEFLGELIYEMPDIIAAGVNIVLGLVEGVINAIPSILDALGVLIDKGWHAITDFDWISIGKNIIYGIADGISSLGHIIGDRLTSIASGAWRGIKSFFGISSPSKLMRDSVGKFIPLGIAEGIEDAADSVYDAMEDLGDGTVGSYDTVFDDIDKKTIGQADRSVNYGGLTFNIYGAEGQDPEEIAIAVRDIIINEEERSKLVYA